ncbi:MAG: hypothetical protein H3C62_04325 [Gemmatimonadaceae bacterium]|nr:hypothetical protein [Gemmatimonadaceae bacterium]
MRGALRALLAERIDYAGLFPPAALSMHDAVSNFASYRGSAEAWALARFVVPVVRLEEFEAAATPFFHGAPWRVSVLAQATDADAIRGFNARVAGDALADTVETRAASAEEIAALAPLADLATVYVELPLRDDPGPLLAMLAAQGLRAKMRTGGVTADAFPTAAQVARFLVGCVQHGVRFKATAGLHHPLRGEYPLTYDAGAPRGTMFGYLNVFLAAALARRGVAAHDVAVLLEERDPAAFRVDDAHIRWRDHALATADLSDDRDALAISFGSCSFREPLDDLSTLPLQ